jgi:hydrogenase expression/formation protein HypD
MLRVPGTKSDLAAARAGGADVRVVYSPLDALELARRAPEREVVFFGLGFETTMPATALTVMQAAKEGRPNFSLFCNHVLVPPPIRALLEDPAMRIDGFVGPGHVSMVIGTEPYRFVAEEFGKPLVVAGFEPLDLLQAVLMVVERIAEGRAEIANQYARVVPAEGNPAARRAMDAVFTPREAFAWRGLGEIDRSGVRIRDAYAPWDAEAKFGVGYAAGGDGELAEGCLCGAVVTGAVKPPACPKFGRDCTPETPLGPLMVSSEGACAAYRRFHPERAA